MEAIIISGMPAVGKTTVSRIVGRELELRVLGGGDVLKEMAVEEGYSPGGDDWWDTEEGMKFLQERKKSATFDKEVDERLLAKAKKGGVVITSYTLPWLSEFGAKVWLSGSVASRARRMARRDHSEVGKCREVLRVRDVENRKLYKKLYDVDFGKDLAPFDLVVDTDSIDEDKVASVVMRYVRSRARG
ncbi:MAG TPA: AAA family ATPase [Nitrososphaerales archaeon]|nr:AAA family ATPase [Nitrososphaerales archaeon]